MQAAQYEHSTAEQTQGRRLRNQCVGCDRHHLIVCADGFYPNSVQRKCKSWRDTQVGERDDCRRQRRHDIRLENARKGVIRLPGYAIGLERKAIPVSELNLRT